MLCCCVVVVVVVVVVLCCCVVVVAVVVCSAAPAGCCTLIVSIASRCAAVAVADEGGGIPRSSLPKIWKYMYTTFPQNFSRVSGDGGTPMDFSVNTPLAGLGYGLPLSRLHAR